MNKDKCIWMMITLIVFVGSLVSIYIDITKDKTTIFMMITAGLLAIVIVIIFYRIIASPILTIEDKGIRIRHPFREVTKEGFGYLKFEDIKYVRYEITDLESLSEDIIIADESKKTLLIIKSNEIGKRTLLDLYGIILENENEEKDIDYNREAIDILMGRVTKKPNITSTVISLYVAGMIFNIVKKLL